MGVFSMKNAQGVLTLISIIYAVIIITITTSRLPKRSMKEKLLGQLDVHFERNRVPVFLTALGVTAAISAVVGYAISRVASLTLEFTVFNIAIMAVVGVNLFLYQRDEHK
jgi:ABC-type enterobactin transport system permease subunit